MFLASVADPVYFVLDPDPDGNLIGSRIWITRETRYGFDPVTLYSDHGFHHIRTFMFQKDKSFIIKCREKITGAGY